MGAARTVDLVSVTIGQPVRHIDVYGGHGWLFRTADGTLWLEHCQAGRWGACRIGTSTTTDREAGKAAMRHLKRKAHRCDAPQQLAGSHHAGGGVRPFIKGPAR